MIIRVKAAQTDEITQHVK